MIITHLISHWHFGPLVSLFITSLTAVYGFAFGFRRSNNNWYFVSAIGFFLIATCSPLHYFGMRYYFSAYMACHVITLLICGPLLVMAFPHRPSQLTPDSLKRLSVYLSSHAWLPWFAGVGIMWFWHVPAVFDRSMAAMQAGFDPMGFLHPLTILAAGFLFSWPLFGPFYNHHLHPLAGVLYLFTACISCSVLGLLITFAPVGIYHHYLLTAGMAAGPWNISLADDQEAAGLIMWVPCCFLYLGSCIYLLFRWLSAKPADVSDHSTVIKPFIMHEHGKQGKPAGHGRA